MSRTVSHVSHLTVVMFIVSSDDKHVGNSIQQSASWVVHTSSASHEFLHISWTVKLCKYVHRSSPLSPLMRRKNEVLVLLFCFIEDLV